MFKNKYIIIKYVTDLGKYLREVTDLFEFVTRE